MAERYFPPSARVTAHITQNRRHCQTNTAETPGVSTNDDPDDAWLLLAAVWLLFDIATALWLLVSCFRDAVTHSQTGSDDEHEDD